MEKFQDEYRKLCQGKAAEMKLALGPERYARFEAACRKRAEELVDEVVGGRRGWR